MKIKRAFVFAIGALCAVCSWPVFAEDKSAGFYAGPLSVAATTVVEVKAKNPVLAKRQRQAAREVDFVQLDKAENQGSRDLKS